MSSDLPKTLKTEKIQQFKLTSPVIVHEDTPLREAFIIMQKRKKGCALVGSKYKISGIFTERDLLTRVIQKKVDLKSPIKDVMTPNPICLSNQATIAEAIQIMNKKGHRHIPLLDEKGGILGFISVRDVVNYIAEHFPAEIYSVPPNPEQINQSPEGA